MTSKKLSLFILYGATFLFGCYPKEPDTAEDFNIVVTKHDVNFDYKSLHTYALPDRVIKVNGSLEKGDSVEFISGTYNDAILSSIRQNLNEFGWTETDQNNDPDVLILPAALVRTISTSDYYYYSSDYWSWWAPTGGNVWYYPYPAYSVTFTMGSVLLLMVYPDGSAKESVPVVWSSLLNGILAGEPDAVTMQIETALNHAFEQSLYLDLTSTQ